MSSLTSATLFEQLKKSFSEEGKAATAKKANAIFQIDVKVSDGAVKTWFIDLKNNADVVTTLAGGKKPDVTVIIGDSDLIDLATGKTTGQKAFSTGKLKVKGNVMQVMKIEGILKSAVPTGPKKEDLKSPERNEPKKKPIIGPSMPPGLKSDHKEENGKSVLIGKEEKGKSLVIGKEENGKSVVIGKEEKGKKVIGPSLPPPQQVNGEDPFAHLRNNSAVVNVENTRESFEDDLGKLEMKLLNTSNPTQINATKDKETESPKTADKTAVRPEWMMVPPELSVRHDPLKARKFAPRTKDIRPDKRWTETPQERMERLCGVKSESEAGTGTGTGFQTTIIKSEKDDTEDHLSESRKRARDERLQDEVQEYNRQHRPKSLLEMHQEKGGRMEKAVKKQQEDFTFRRFDRNRDMKSGANISSSDRKKMLERLSNLGDRFSSAKSSDQSSFL